jgi:hypothetical protein
MAAPELVTGSEPTWNSQGGTNDALNDLNDNNMKDGESDDCGYSEYCEAIQEEGGAFYQIGAELFVVNGWDPRTRTSKVSLIYFCAHSFGLISISLLGTTYKDPPLAKDLLPSAGAHWPGRMSLASTNDFLPNMERNYSRWMNSHTVSGCIFHYVPSLKIVGDDKAVLFSRQEVEEGLYINHFSTPSPNSRSLNGRVIVEYTGDDTGTGRWLCSKDSSISTCAHISKCRDMLQKLVLVDPTAKDNNGIGDGCSIDYLGLWFLGSSNQSDNFSSPSRTS